MAPKVSVIIPAFNAERYIADTLQSVLRQTYHNYEVVVVDDGSTDGTLQVLRNFEHGVKVLTKPNGGPASARNVAINNSDGELIAFLDSDDLWMEQKLEEQVAFLTSHPAVGLAYGEALMFRQSSDEEAKRKIGYTEAPTFCKLLYGDFIPNSTVVVRRACVRQVGLLNESRALISVEDYEYWMRIAKVFPIAGIPRPLAYYRVRDDSLMGDGRDIDKGLRLSIAAIQQIERLYPEMWKECGVDRDLLLARLHIRAGFAWKQKREWRKCLHWFLRSTNYSINPKVFRWIIAATLLKRWS